MTRANVTPRPHTTNDYPREVFLHSAHRSVYRKPLPAASTPSGATERTALLALLFAEGFCPTTPFHTAKILAESPVLRAHAMRYRSLLRELLLTRKELFRLRYALQQLSLAARAQVLRAGNLAVNRLTLPPADQSLLLQLLQTAELSPHAIVAQRCWEKAFLHRHGDAQGPIPQNLTLHPRLCFKGGTRFVYKSPAGLGYPSNALTEHTIDHVCAHLGPRSQSSVHSIFNVSSPEELVALVDEAYERIPPSQRVHIDIVVPMDRFVGIAANQAGLRIVLHNGMLGTAHPHNVRKTT